MSASKSAPYLFMVAIFSLTACQVPIRPPYETEIPVEFSQHYSQGSQYRSLASIEGAIERQKAGLNTLYQLKFGHEAPEGRVFVVFALTPDGTVAAVQVVDDSFGNSDFESAVADYVQSINFGPAKGKGYYLCAYPLRFVRQMAPSKAVTTVPLPATTSYFATVQQIIEAKTVYPKQAERRFEQGIAIAKVKFGRDGVISGAELVQSAGSKDLDDEALAIFGRVKAFPPVPADFQPQADTFEISLPISFSLQ